jgi:hypothetical protein
MNKNSILSEGFFDKIIKMLRKNPKVSRNIKDMNKIVDNLEGYINSEYKAMKKKKKVKLQRFKPEDFLK